jgi:hypothetical protein
MEGEMTTRERYIHILENPEDYDDADYSEAWDAAVNALKAQSRREAKIDRAVVFCKDCKHLHPVRSVLMYVNYCKASPLEPVYDFVHGQRVNDEYDTCQNVNRNGKCKLFEARECR